MSDIPEIGGSDLIDGYEDNGESDAPASEGDAISEGDASAESDDKD